MLMSVVIAQPRTNAQASDAANAVALAGDAGALRRHSPSPSSGSMRDANTHIGTQRRIVGAVRSATARAYHSQYRSTGRHSSYATAPLRTIARISASAFHGNIAS